MFTNTQKPEERLRVWRNFRQQFPSDGTPHGVANAFADVKLKPRYLDYYTPGTWPNVFDIVLDGMFCQTGLTLVMASTLANLGFIKDETLTFAMVSNNITGVDGAVLIHDNKCYNFIPGEVVDLSYMRENSVQYHEEIITTDKLFA